jgi:hypothetical protein
MIWEGGILDFLIVTLVLGGGAAFLTGRSCARSWQPLWRASLWMLPLAFGVRFVHFALFRGTLLSPQFFLVDLVVLLIAAACGYRLTHVQQMTRLYGWIIESNGAWSWRRRATQEPVRTIFSA